MGLNFNKQGYVTLGEDSISDLKKALKTVYKRNGKAYYFMNGTFKKKTVDDIGLSFTRPPKDIYKISKSCLSEYSFVIFLEETINENVVLRHYFDFWGKKLFSMYYGSSDCWKYYNFYIFEGYKDPDKKESVTYFVDITTLKKEEKETEVIEKVGFCDYFYFDGEVSDNPKGQKSFFFITENKEGNQTKHYITEHIRGIIHSKCDILFKVDDTMLVKFITKCDDGARKCRLYINGRYSNERHSSKIEFSENNLLLFENKKGQKAFFIKFEDNKYIFVNYNGIINFWHGPKGQKYEIKWYYDSVEYDNENERFKTKKYFVFLNRLVDCYLDFSGEDIVCEENEKIFEHHYIKKYDEFNNGIIDGMLVSEDGIQLSNRECRYWGDVYELFYPIYASLRRYKPDYYMPAIEKPEKIFAINFPEDMILLRPDGSEIHYLGINDDGKYVIDPKQMPDYDIFDNWECSW